MDNDIKIKKNKNTQRHKEVLLFLNDELKNLQVDSKNNTYNLEEEYSKTKKNKSPFTFLVLFISFLIVILVSMIVINNISNNNKEIKVELHVFEDLNLKNLIDSVSKVQNNYDQAVKNKTNIIKEKESKLGELAAEKDMELFVIDSLNLRSKREIDRRKNEILENYNNSVNQIENEYKNKILLVESEILEYSKQLEQFDSNKVESAKEKEQLLNTERQIQKMEMDKLSVDYESRIKNLENMIETERLQYNQNMKDSISEVAEKYQAEIDLLDPVLEDANAKRLIREQKDTTVEVLNVNNILVKNNISDRDSDLFKNINRFQTDYESHVYLQKPFLAIPYKNSLSEYVQASNKILYDMGKTYENTTSDLIAEVTDLNSQIELLKEEHQSQLEAVREQAVMENQAQIRVLDILLAKEKNDALVIGAESKDSVMIYVAEENRSSIGEEGLSVEIRASKTIKGSIVPFEEAISGIYLFIPGQNRNGDVIEFEIDEDFLGSYVKLLK